MVVPIVAGAVLGILWSIVNAVRQIIEWFEKKGFRTIVAHLNTAVKLVDMARSRGMLDQDRKTCFLGFTLRPLMVLTARQSLRPIETS